MDPSYRSPYVKRADAVLEPPKRWAEKFYQPKASVMSRLFRRYRLRDERTIAGILFVVCVGTFFFPIAKMIVDDAIICWKNPELFNPFGYCTEEQKAEIRAEQESVQSVNDFLAMWSRKDAHIIPTKKRIPEK